MKPAKSMERTAHQVRIAPPVSKTSVTFMAASIAIIEMSDIPIAVLKAVFRAICLLRITVSKIIDVIKPFIMAKIIIAATGQSMPDNWK